MSRRSTRPRRRRGFRGCRSAEGKRRSLHVPIDHRIDNRRRVVVARGHGTVTHEGVYGYQREVWSRDDVAGYDELVDMSDVKEIALPSLDSVRELAALSSEMDSGASATKFTIVAPQDIAF